MKKAKLTERVTQLVLSCKEGEMTSLKVGGIAEKIGVNSSYLSRRFNGVKNMTLNEFITGVKMWRCAAQLSKRGLHPQALRDPGIRFPDRKSKKIVFSAHISEELIKSRSTIQELSDMMGYSRSDYFVTLFKKQFGIHPKNFGKIKQGHEKKF